MLIALDPGVQVSPGELAAAWDADEQPRTLGPAAVEAPPARGEFLPDVLTLVAIPVGVNLASTAITAVVGRLVARLRNTRPDPPEIEVAELTSVRVRETVPDAILEQAAEVELIDISPEELLERLKAKTSHARRSLTVYAARK